MSRCDSRKDATRSNLWPADYAVCQLPKGHEGWHSAHHSKGVDYAWLEAEEDE